MFSSFISVLQGDDANDSDSETGEAKPDKEAASSSASAWSYNLTDLANGLVESVKEHTTEFTHTVTSTDWTSEITAFTSEVKKGAAEVAEEVASMAAPLPSALPGTQGQAAGAEHTQSSISSLSTGGFGEVGSEISKFGASLMLGTSEIFSEVQKTVASEIDKATKSTKDTRSRTKRTAMAAVNGKYSRFETEVSTMQRDSGTYCDEPEDQEDFGRFKQGFDLSAKKADIDDLVSKNAFMAELQSRIVPLIVEHEAFWTRYFYRLSKLQEKHDKRQALAMRAAEPQAEEEEVGWGDDDDEEAEGAGEAEAASAGAPASSSKDAEAPAPAAAAPEKEALAVPAAAPVAAEDPPLAVAVNDEEVQPDHEDAESNPYAPSPAPEALSEKLLPVPKDEKAQEAEEHQQKASSLSSGIQVSSNPESSQSSKGTSVASADWCVLSSPSGAGGSKGVHPKPVVEEHQQPSLPSPLNRQPSEDAAGEAAWPTFEEDGSDEEGPAADAAAASEGPEAKKGGDDDDDLDEDWGAV